MSAILKLRVTATGKPVRAGQDHFWAVIRRLDAHGPWTVPAVIAQSPDALGADVRAYVRRLVKAGWAEEQAKDGEVSRYRLLRRPVRGPSIDREGRLRKPGQVNRQIWTAIRGLATFSYREITVAASTEDVPIAEGTVKKYLTRLSQAGYLRVVEPGGPCKPRTYALKRSMDTGPEAPRVLRTKLVWDQNREQIMGEAIAEEDRP